jgi:protease PrsW
LLTTLAIVSLVIAPAGFLLYYFWVRDRWEKEPWSLIWKLFAMGGVSVIPAAVLELLFLGSETEVKTIGEAFVTSFFGVALVEEGTKLLFVYFAAYRSRHFREEYDGIIYAVAVGLGFAFIENILYVIMGLVEGSSGLSTAIARAFTAVPSHALDGVVLGYFLGKSRFQPSAASRLSTNLLGLAMATAFHGLYDFFVFLIMVIPPQTQGWCIVGIVWTLIVQWGTAHRLILSAQVCSKQRWLECIAKEKMAVVENGSAPRKFCRFCGAEVDFNANHCPQCGANLQHHYNDG